MRAVQRYSLCALDELANPASKGFEMDTGDEVVSLFVVRRDNEVRGYINSCPHTGANLEWQEDQFLDMDNMFIQCSTHDALFEIDTGHCVAGPCVGDHLQAVKLVIDNGQVSAQLDP